MDHTVAGALNQESRAVDDNGRCIGRIVRAAARSTYPHGLAGLFVERHEAVCAASVLAPLERYAADNHEITIDDRRHCASAVRGEQSKVFTERTFPHDFSIAIETDEISTDAKHIDVSRRRIANWGRPTDAMWRHVAQVNVEAMFPQKFSSVGVEAHDTLL